ncbi:fasciclin domain-containing protein [uncultured Bacteroides sp.]|uniref:fasciclin domain-containing protein n=1 Tax=uncultured Bacteroides sp. TaxID=162156 RepID=UPI0025DEB026|nr:fasciclin domain-containing protein [uncultured Bacteroides sp.]
MKLKNIKKVFALLAFPLFLTSCELFGLDFQDSYDFDYNEGMPSNKVNMSTYDFICSRTDIFSLLQEAIEYAGLENEFKRPNATYLLPTNKAFNSEEEADKSYFQIHQLSYIDEVTNEEVFYVPISMKSYPKEQVKEFLLYHIVKGQYTFTNLPAEPAWYDTFATGETAKVNMYILKDRNPNIVFNNFDGHYKATIKPRTANLYSIDGSYIHVLDSWLDRPTEAQLPIK